jgi:hypothetical protein
MCILEVEDISRRVVPVLEADVIRAIVQRDPLHDRCQRAVSVVLLTLCAASWMDGACKDSHALRGNDARERCQSH